MYVMIATYALWSQYKEESTLQIDGDYMPCYYRQSMQDYANNKDIFILAQVHLVPGQKMKEREESATRLFSDPYHESQEPMVRYTRLPSD